MGRLQHKRGRPSNYRKLLSHNPYWEEVKREVRIRDGHCCQQCGKTYCLEIHHKTYRVNGVSIVGRELDFLDCLVTLCEDCHARVHGRG
ncbi:MULTISPECIES: HNH endonuclease [Bacteroides]|uniref:HNH endonuclease n=1 Tax=Bacteroides TaxID=816 RepID=UPI001C8B442B|nr:MULTISPECIES: HNH endonuclease [Bacteroides]MBX9187409.1 HNH endonuclease [Bacteroides sp. K03]MCQ4915638.1 HNH endonuclease [Bacteroides nordii]